MKANVRLVVKVLALVAILGFTTASAWAEDKGKGNATGTWKWTRKSPDGQEQEISATLKQDGEKLTGTVMSPLGEVEIKDGKVKNGQITFKISFEREGNEITVNFSGKLEGDKIKGKVEIGGGDQKRTMDWEPTRAKK
jgi:hypothetical protein